MFIGSNISSKLDLLECFGLQFAYYILVSIQLQVQMLDEREYFLYPSVNLITKSPLIITSSVIFHLQKQPTNIHRNFETDRIFILLDNFKFLPQDQNFYKSHLLQYICLFESRLITSSFPHCHLNPTTTVIKQLVIVFSYFAEKYFIFSIIPKIARYCLFAE